MSTIARGFVRFESDNDGLDRGVRGAKRAMVGLSAGLNIATAAFARLAAAAGVAIGTITLMVQRSRKIIDGNAKLADRLGGTVAGLQRQRHAAAEAGVSADRYNKALERLNIRLGALKTTGVSPASDALDVLGVALEELQGMPIEEKVKLLADAFEKLDSSIAKASAAQDLFGSNGQELVNLLQQGSEAIREAEAEAASLGLGLSRVDARKVEQMNDAWNRLKTAITAFSEEMTVALAPTLEVIFNLLAEMIAWVNNNKAVWIAFGAAVVGIIDDITKSIEWVMRHIADMLRGISILVNALSQFSVYGPTAV